MKEISPEELARCNGENGNPAYVAAGGAVIDVTASKMWKDGLHARRHKAGMDLTADLQAAPHGTEVLARYPQVGIFKKEEVPERELPPLLSSLLRRFPFLRRHPHPMTVHFPIVFMFSTAIFTFLYCVTGIESFESTALNCLGAGLLFMPVAMATGYYTWWLNYMARPLRAVAIKQRLSLFLLTMVIIDFIWRLTVPDILQPFRLASAVYLIFIFSLLPLVTVIGWFGATLTMPVEKE